jgi:tetratricopeptide (TPR) repeat protein
VGAAGLEKSAVEAELERVLASAPFGRSQQVAQFLRYIVEAKLRGDEATIKAYAVAVDVFGRPQNFDPQVDPIVRVQARRLRGMLESFYAAGPSPHGVEIRLPTGRYVPEFVSGAQAGARPAADSVSDSASQPDAAAAPESHLPAASPPASAPSRFAGRWLLALALLPSMVLLVLVSVWSAVQLGWIRLMPADVLPEPVVVVGDFVPVPSWGGAYVSVPGLAVELVTDLQLFENLDARLKGVDAEVPGAFQLSGLVRPEGGNVLVTATLRRTGTDAVAWSHSVVVPINGLSERIDDISQRLSEQLGANFGPLHKPGRDWIAVHPDAFRSGDPYICRLLMADSITAGGADKVQQARTCMQALLQQQPESGFALVASAGLRLLSEAQQRPPGDFAIETRAAAMSAIAKGRAASGTSAIVWLGIGYAFDLLGQGDKAVDAYRNSLQLNPADLDAQALLGRHLVLAGPSMEGTALAEGAVSNSAIVPPWYRTALAVDSLRNGDNAALLRQGQLAATADSELSAVLAAVGGRRLGQAELLDRYLAQALESPRIKKYGMLPVLRTLVSDPELLRTIAAEMSLAGVDAAEINGPLS